MKYEVKLMYMYSYTTEVEAEDKEQAISIASDEDIEEAFESFYDAEAIELNE